LVLRVPDSPDGEIDRVPEPKWWWGAVDTNEFQPELQTAVLEIHRSTLYSLVLARFTECVGAPRFNWVILTSGKFEDKGNGTVPMSVTINGEPPTSHSLVFLSWRFS